MDRNEEIATLVAAENERLAVLLDGLDEAAWRTPSECPGWTVRDVVVHLLMAYRLSIPRFLLGMLTHRFDFDRLALRWAADDTRPPEKALADLRSTVTEPFNVPGAPPEAPLSHLVIHAQDVARPLGLPLDPDPRAAVLTLDQLTGPRFTYLTEQTRAALTWVATDVGSPEERWRHGDGPEVRGTTTAMVTVLGGRAVALGELEGPGVGELRRRLRP